MVQIIGTWMRWGADGTAAHASVASMILKDGKDIGEDGRWVAQRAFAQLTLAALAQRYVARPFAVEHAMGLRALVRGQQRLAIGATTDCVLELRDGGLRYAARLLARLHAEVVKRCAPNSTPNPNSNPDP